MASTITTLDQLGQAIVQHQNVVLQFKASWSPQCSQISDVIAELAKLYQNVQFFQIEAEEVPEASEKFEVVAVPTCIVLQNQKVSERIDGAHPAQLSKAVEKISKSVVITPASKPAPVVPSADLNARIAQLINAAPVMLFMKGSPDTPRCGFSKQTVQILNDAGVKFSSFDILADDDVRQGLKTFSNWPTYPQLYISGQLVGGLDILKELVEAGELQAMLPKADDLEARLKSLIARDPVMVFIKGSPQEPRCGFSKKIVDLLNSTQVAYGYYDILGDEEVRQGLKKFSNWPTYPQVYVKGELIGGLDIVTELDSTGDLVSTLSGTA